MEGTRTVTDQPDNTLRPTLFITNWIWLIVVCAFVLVLVGAFVTLALSMFVKTTSAQTQTILTMFTSVAGFLAGLIAPSPVSGQQGAGQDT
jgi:hypothetical protein